MPKRIVVCADGTWNRPERDLENDHPTNVLKLARAIKPMAGRTPQHVFYDWGIGSYYARVTGGATGKGINKNIMDAYRHIIQNYTPGAEIFLFGFSRGAYTVRSLCGLINNCGILRRPNARRIQQAFDYYKRESGPYRPHGAKSEAFRRAHSYPSAQIAFVGVWDTVGALGIPFSVMGLLDASDEFYDRRLCSNVQVARHALAIDERRIDFEPTIWRARDDLDLQQVWFAGSHADVGGGHAPDPNGDVIADIPMRWLVREAKRAGLVTEPHLTRGLGRNPVARTHRSRRHIYRLRKERLRNIDHGQGPVRIHRSVKQRWYQDPDYRPPNLASFIERNGWRKVVAD
jgi:uncharacterized protein (DUF2235 family)